MLHSDGVINHVARLHHTPVRHLANSQIRLQKLHNTGIVGEIVRYPGVVFP